MQQDSPTCPHFVLHKLLQSHALLPARTPPLLQVVQALAMHTLLRLLCTHPEACSLPVQCTAQLRPAPQIQPSNPTQSLLAAAAAAGGRAGPLCNYEGGGPDTSSHALFTSLARSTASFSSAEGPSPNESASCLTLPICIVYRCTRFCVLHTLHMSTRCASSLLACKIKCKCCCEAQDQSRPF